MMCERLMQNTQIAAFEGRRKDTPMSMPIPPQRVPLRQDEYGVLRVGNSRVLFELVVHAFNQGDTPETIVQSYDTLKLG